MPREPRRKSCIVARAAAAVELRYSVNSCAMSLSVLPAANVNERATEGPGKEARAANR